MGIFRMGDITKAGPGIEKDAPKKRGFFAFFELFFRKIGRLCKLNMLYLAASLPVLVIMFFLAGLISTPVVEFCSPALASALEMSAPDMTNNDFAFYIGIIDVSVRIMTCILFLAIWGAGPVTAGFTYVLRNYAREEHAWLWSDFWQHTKENFKQALAVIIIDIVVFGLAFYAYLFYGSMGGSIAYFKFFIVAGVFVFSLMHIYIYQIMVTFKLSLKNIYKNALLFTMLNLPLNLLVLALVVIVHMGIPYIGIKFALLGTQPLFWLIYVLLEILILISFSGFIMNFSIYPSIKKNMIERVEAGE